MRCVVSISIYLIVILLHLQLHVSLISCAVSEAQLKAAGKLVRKNCQPKTKTSDESIDNMHKGVWDEEPSAKCYAFCVMSFYKLVNKKGIFDEEAAMAQLDMLPEARRDPTWASAQNCKTASDCCTEKCDRAYAILKCVYFDNTENYFAP